MSTENKLTIAVIVTIIILTSITIATAIAEEPVNRLTETQVTNPQSTMTPSDYINLTMGGCSDDLIHYLNKGIWSEHWCAVNYSNIDRTSINGD